MQLNCIALHFNPLSSTSSCNLVISKITSAILNGAVAIW